MSEHIKIITLLQERESLEHQLGSIVYGAVEIREREQKRYLYVHYRQDGVAYTKYVGEYSADLHNIILSNTVKAKELKKRIKAIDKELKSLDYVESQLEPNVALNVDFARSQLVNTIYKQAVLEGVATTYSDTETIVEGGKVSNMTPDDIMKVVNLKHAWEFVLNKNVVQSPTNFALLCEINRLVEEGFYYNAGQVRSTPVAIGGTSWKPPIPVESAVKEELQAILDSDFDVVDKATELVLFVMKRQIFIDGNKRTAVIFANHLLIANGVGLIAVPEDSVAEYKKLLVAYYEGTDEQAIKTFIKQKCYNNVEKK